MRASLATLLPPVNLFLQPICFQWSRLFCEFETQLFVTLKSLEPYLYPLSKMIEKVTLYIYIFFFFPQLIILSYFLGLRSI